MSRAYIQCSHKVIINISRDGIKKEIFPYVYRQGDYCPAENLLIQNYYSLDIDLLNTVYKPYEQFILSADIEIQFFIFHKKEIIVFDTDKDFRETSYFRIIFIEKGLVTYEDYDYQLLFDVEKVKRIINSKLTSFNEIVTLPVSQSDINEFDILFPPGVGGYFIHETVGHLLESDNALIYEKEEVVSITALNVVDNIIGYEKMIGLNKYDDDHHHIYKVDLIKNGTIFDNINETNGSSRSDNLNNQLLPRMRTTFVENSDFYSYAAKDKYHNYVEVSQIFGGGVDVRSGNYQLLVRGIIYEDSIAIARIENAILKGDSKGSLSKIVYIGNDLKIMHAYCVKNGQLIDVGVGSPTLFLKKG